MNLEREDLVKLVFTTVTLSFIAIVACVSIMIFLPADGETVAPLIGSVFGQNEKIVLDFDSKDKFELQENVTDVKQDLGLAYYRQPQSRAGVEWFYSSITDSSEIAQAILTSADEYNIPLSLAFALAYTESGFNVNALHKNTNGSIDRGLFQLNSNSFPKLTESDFFNPSVSAHYGLSHLRFCLNSAGNEIAALAMYNAGTTKVKKNNTPQTTLNYISQIQSYRATLDENFEAEVIALYSRENLSKMLAKR